MFLYPSTQCPAPALAPSTIHLYLLNSTAALSEISVYSLGITCLLQLDCPLFKSEEFILALVLYLKPDSGGDRGDGMWGLRERAQTKNQVPFIEEDV